ncbi:hypothetical protein DENSPDRAFT_831489 [Dentipellis sp. KUC8613]|nr:hypothetical protein DENSPDRAFT_831489 [Dentipellis sp. KUC8613]
MSASQLSQFSSRLLRSNNALVRAIAPSTRYFAVTSATRAETKHTADSYFKDVDSTLSEDPKTLTVDSSSEAVQRPHHPPSGEFSRAGIQTDEYRSVDKQHPYDAPNGAGKDQKLRYGARPQYLDEKGPETSGSEEGPTGRSAGGRKPEGKQ